MNRLRSLLTVVTATAAVGAATIAAPGTAYADPPVTPGASAFSAAATTGSSSLQANLQLSGSLGGLLDVLISPIVTQALDPLVAALQSSLNTTVASLLGASSSLHVDTPVTQSGSLPGAFPNDAAPSPCPSAGPVPCYQAAGGEAVDAAPLVSLGLGAITGWTQQVPSSLDATLPMYGRAQVASATVSALSGITSLTNPVVSTGTVDAKANCPNDGKSGSTKPQTAPSALVQDAGIKLLGGQVTFDVLDGQIANLVVGGTAYATLQSLGSVSLSNATVGSYGNAVLVSIPIAAADLLGAIGLSNSVVTQLLGYSPTSTVTLSVIVGPSAQPTVNTASAYGLQIGVDLSGSLGFNLLGLVGATVNLPSGISSSNSGNLLDVRLATVTCASGNGISAVTAAIPPALV